MWVCDELIYSKGIGFMFSLAFSLFVSITTTLNFSFLFYYAELTNTLIVHLDILYEGTMAKVNAKLCMYKDVLSFVFIMLRT